jgi:hypothetical protein
MSQANARTGHGRNGAGLRCSTPAGRTALDRIDFRLRTVGWVAEGRAKRLVSHAGKEQLVAQLPLIEAALERKPWCLDVPCRVRCHDALPRVLSICSLAFTREESAGILHVVDVLHSSRIRGVGRREAVVAVIEEKAADRHSAHGCVRQAPSYVVQMQKGGQAASRATSHHDILGLTQSVIGKEVVNRRIEVTAAAEHEARAGAGDRPRVLTVSREGGPVAIVQIRSVRRPFTCVARRADQWRARDATPLARRPRFGRAQAGLGTFSAARLVVAPPTTLKRDGPIFGAFATRTPEVAVLGAIKTESSRVCQRHEGRVRRTRTATARLAQQIGEHVIVNHGDGRDQGYEHPGARGLGVRSRGGMLMGQTASRHREDRTEIGT